MLRRQARTARAPHRRGSSYLEVQVAMAVFLVGVSGLAPLTVVNSRQFRTLQERMPADRTCYLVPPEDSWSAKLGARADVRDQAPAIVTEPPSVVDDGDASCTLMNAGAWDWDHPQGSHLYGGQATLNTADGAGDELTFTFTGLLPCRYRVLVTYPASDANATNAPFHIYDDGTLLDVIQLNQREAPDGPAWNGFSWKSLGTFPITRGVLRVVLADVADSGWVAADAMRIEPVKNRLNVLAVSRSPADSTLELQVSVTSP